MKISCKFCGKIHDKKFDCGKKPVRIQKKKWSEQNAFRNTNAWIKKREQIRARDKNLCQICKRGLMMYGAPRFNFDNLSVHHNIPLEEDYTKRLANDNLILVCSAHHEMCENGMISRELIKSIIDEQNSKTFIE